MRHLLGIDRRLHQLWFARHHDPRDDVSQETCSSENCHDQPNDSDDGDVEIEVLRESQADTRDGAPLPRTHKPLARFRRAGYAPPTVGAEIRVVLNDFAAVIAIHGTP